MSKWVKTDGSLDLDALDALESSVRAVTDSNQAIDAIIKAEKLGQPKVLAFRCAHSTGYWPGDYVKQWGILYGVGNGPVPVSESWDSQYHVTPSITAADDVTQLMHPVQVSLAQVDMVTVPADEFNAGKLITEKDDPRGNQRVKILFQKQLANPRSRLKLIMAQLQSQKGLIGA